MPKNMRENKESKIKKIILLCVIVIFVFSGITIGISRTLPSKEKDSVHASTNNISPTCSEITKDCAKVTATPPTKKESFPKIISKVSNDLKKKYRNINFTNEWIDQYQEMILFGALKKDSTQGIAVDIDMDGHVKKYLSSKKYGAIKAQRLLGSSSAVQVSAKNGHIWIFNLSGLGFSEKPNGGVYSGKWDPIERLRYVEGKIISLHHNDDKTAILNLKIIVNYHNGCDPINDSNFPFEIGSRQKFVLQRLPDMKLRKGEDVILYHTGFYPLSGSMDRFDGAAVMYYKKGDNYYDKDNHIITIPPQDYPDYDEVFNQSTN